MVRVKICGLTNLDDARQAAACGADLLGFIQVPASPRYVTPNQAASIIAALRASGCAAQMVGVFADQPTAAVNATARHCEFDLVQLHGGENIQYTQHITYPFLLAHRVQGPIPWSVLTAYRPAALLLDAYHPRALGGTGQVWDWQALAGAPGDLPLILAGGLEPGNVAAAIATAAQLGVSLWGVDVSSGVERAPGRKDHDRVRALIEAAKGAQP